MSAIGTHDIARGGDALLGRDAELVELAAVLERSRLVTLAGPPGIGKSRLGFELARTLDADRRDGVELVELAAVSEGRLIPGALAATLGVQETTGQDLTDTLAARLGNERRLLLLDNCEHLLQDCAAFVEVLLGRCPRLSILATSREPLGISDESVFRVPPLMDHAAVQLFVERAQSVEPRFTHTAYVAPAVSEVCRHLDGIPLAIELAAAQVGTLTPDEIALRLNARFELLTVGSRSDLPRHRTLEAAIDWSHELLHDGERTLFRRLAVFPDSFTADAAAAVCAGAEIDADEVPELLARLADKSLLTADGGSFGMRYQMLETIRAYAVERLEQAGEWSALRDSHARFYLTSRRRQSLH